MFRVSCSGSRLNTLRSQLLNFLTPQAWQLSELNLHLKIFFRQYVLHTVFRYRSDGKERIHAGCTGNE